MAHKHWLILIGIALAFGIRGACAGGVWLMITSEPSGATIVVDNAYRGVTPQRSDDALRIQVSEGTRKINAHARIDGQDYSAQKIIKVRKAREIAVRLQLRAASAPVSDVPPATSPTYTGKPWYEWSLPPGNVEVPGRNF